VSHKISKFTFDTLDEANCQGFLDAAIKGVSNHPIDLADLS